MAALFLFLKGMTGALAPFSYLVFQILSQHLRLTPMKRVILGTNKSLYLASLLTATMTTIYMKDSEELDNL
jgi:hypothetical protein